MKILKSKYRLLPLIWVAAAVFAFSCNKDKSQSLTPEEESQAATASSESNTEAETVFTSLFDDAMGVSNDVGMAGVGIFANPPSCAIVTMVHLNTTTFFPLKATIDFGTGCVANDYHNRKGKIIITYTDRLINAGSSATTEFENYYIDSTHVEGTFTIRNTTTGSGQTLQKQFTIESDAKLTKASGNYQEWHSSKVITQIEGNLTPTIPQDDAFTITGSAHGKTKKNDIIVLWNSNILEPLLKRFNCRWISKGKVQTGRQNLSANSTWYAVLDYGNGNCDYLATLTINGVTRQITLH
jgi:hypothetical protein